MSVNPTPSTEAVNAVARAMSAPREHLASHFERSALRVLVAAWPTIVSDVLNHYAETADSRADRPKHWTSDVSGWLRDQAEAVKNS